MADKKGRVNSIIKRNLTEIMLYELKSDVCKYSSISEVKVAPDYSTCKVYVSDIDPNKSDSVVGYLNNNKGKIRTLLSKKLDIFKTPELLFIRDTMYERTSSLDKKIEEANLSKPKTLKDVYGDDYKLKDE